MPFISVPSLNFTTNVRFKQSNIENIQYGFWDDGSWDVSVSSWKNSPDTVIGNGSFEEGIDGWNNHSEENFTDENGKEHVFDTTWNPLTQKMKYEVTPNDLQFQSISSKLIQYPFESDVWYKFKSTINYLPEDVTPFTKFILSIWKEGDVPDINNVLAEQSFDVDQLTNGQEISLDFMPTDEIDGVLESLQMGFRLSDNSTDSTDNVVVEVDDVKVTDSQDNELQRTYTLSLEKWSSSSGYQPVPIGENGLPSVEEGSMDSAGSTLDIVLETDGLVEDTKVPFYVESPPIEGPTLSTNGKMTNKDGFGNQISQNVFNLYKETSTSTNMISRVPVQVFSNVVCIRPQTIVVWVPHPELDGRENALAEIEFEVTPNIEIYDKSQCEPVYISIQKNNISPQEGDTMGFDLVGERMTNGIIPEGSQYPIGTWNITNSSIGISSPTSGSFTIDSDNIVPITVVQTIEDGIYTGGGGFTMNVTIGETSLSVGASFSDSTDPP